MRDTKEKQQTYKTRRNILNLITRPRMMSKRLVRHVWMGLQPLSMAHASSNFHAGVEDAHMYST